MDERDRHAPLAHSRGDALDRPMSYVAYSEDARDTCLEQIGIALERPVQCRSRLQQIHHVASGAHIAPLIADHVIRDPRRFGVRADEDEQRVALTPLSATR